MGRVLRLQNSGPAPPPQPSYSPHGSSVLWPLAVLARLEVRRPKDGVPGLSIGPTVTLAIRIPWGGVVPTGSDGDALPRGPRLLLESCAHLDKGKASELLMGHVPGVGAYRQDSQCGEEERSHLPPQLLPRTPLPGGISAHLAWNPGPCPRFSSPGPDGLGAFAPAAPMLLQGWPGSCTGPTASQASVGRGRHIPRL